MSYLEHLSFFVSILTLLTYTISSLHLKYFSNQQPMLHFNTLFWSSKYWTVLSSDMEWCFHISLVASIVGKMKIFPKYIFCMTHRSLSTIYEFYWEEKPRETDNKTLSNLSIFLRALSKITVFCFSYKILLLISMKGSNVYWVLSIS